MVNYKIRLSLLIAILTIGQLTAQKKGIILNRPKPTPAKPSVPTTTTSVDEEMTYEEQQVKKVIMDLFDGMRTANGYMVKQLFEPTATLASVSKSQLGNVQYQNGDINTFITAIGRPRTDVWDERVWSYDINIDGPLAKAWTPYSFYVNDQLSHCGVNDFELINKNGQWKISRIIDTRRKTGCITDPKTAINTLMDQWHNAAAIADEDVFFGSMTDDGIYIGTDASERWTRDEMKSLMMKYFQRDSAWDFKAKSRNISLSEDGNTAWFDELLDTWMGDCRSTGVVVKQGNEWKIKYYHLSIAVPNDVVDGYLKLLPTKLGRR